MQFLHSREFMNSGDIAEVNSSHQCNITLMDDINFNNYKNGKSFKCIGGFFEKLPARIAAPSSGYWNIVLDLAGGTATIKHSVRIIKR